MQEKIDVQLATAGTRRDAAPPSAGGTDPRAARAAGAIAYPVVTGSGGRLLGSRSFVARDGLLRDVTP
jgi:hypothetical protein